MPYKVLKSSGTFFDDWTSWTDEGVIGLTTGDPVYGGFTVLGTPPETPTTALLSGSGTQYAYKASGWTSSPAYQFPHHDGILSDAPIVASWTAPAGTQWVTFQLQTNINPETDTNQVPQAPENVAARGEYAFRDFDAVISVNGTPIITRVAAPDPLHIGSQGGTGLAEYALSAGDVLSITSSLSSDPDVIPPDGFILSGRFFTAGEEEPDCTFEIDPAERTVSRTAHTGMTVALTASSEECEWTAESNDDWLTVTGADSGTGDGTVTYSVDANDTGETRIGTITIGGETHTVTQQHGKTIAFAGVIGAPAPSISPRQRGYTHTQATPATVWDIPHNLGHYPSVSAVDGATGSALEGDVSHPTLNRTTITFGSARSGSASLT